MAADMWHWCSELQKWIQDQEISTPTRGGIPIQSRRSTRDVSQTLSSSRRGKLPKSHCFAYEDVEAKTRVTIPCKPRRKQWRDYPSLESDLWYSSSLAPDMWPRWTKSKHYNPLNVCRKLNAWERITTCNVAAEKESSGRETRPCPSTHQMASLTRSSKDLGQNTCIPTSSVNRVPSLSTSGSVSSSTSQGSCASTYRHSASKTQKSCKPRSRSSLPACDVRSKEARRRREDNKMGTYCKSSKSPGGQFGSLVSNSSHSNQVQCGANGEDDEHLLQRLPHSVVSSPPTVAKFLHAHQVQSRADGKGQQHLLPHSDVSYPVARHLQSDPAQCRAHSSSSCVADLLRPSPLDVCWRSIPAHVAANKVEDWVTIFGFGADGLKSVVEEFGKCGQITNYMTGPEGANYIHIEFQNPRDAQKAILKNGMRINGVLLLVAKKLLVDPREDRELHNISRPQSSTSRTSFVKLETNINQLPKTNLIRHQESNNTQLKANTCSTSRTTNFVDFVHDSQRDHQHASTSTQLESTCHQHQPKLESIQKEVLECNCPNEFVTPMLCECTSPKRIYFDCLQIGRKECNQRQSCVVDCGKDIVLETIQQPPSSCIRLDQPRHRSKEFETIENLRSLRDKIKSLHVML